MAFPYGNYGYGAGYGYGVEDFSVGAYNPRFLIRQFITCEYISH